MKNATRNLLRIVRGTLAGAGFATLSLTARAAGGPVATRITAENYELHLFALYAALAIAVVVLGVMLLSMALHRKTATRTAGTFHRSVAVEILWAVIPWVIIVGAAWPATAVLSEIESPSRADITIRAQGMQWKWSYRYLKGDGEGIAFESNVYAPGRTAAAGAGSGGNRLDVDNPVVVPVGKRVRVVLEADEGIHSWHVPELGVKQYAVPGMVRDTWFHARRTGVYRGLCSIEACGAGRACVLIVVKVVSDGDYRRWVEGRKANLAAGARETTVRGPAPAPDSL